MPDSYAFTQYCAMNYNLVNCLQVSNHPFEFLGMMEREAENADSKRNSLNRGASGRRNVVIVDDDDQSAQPTTRSGCCS